MSLSCLDMEGANFPAGIRRPLLLVVTLGAPACELLLSNARDFPFSPIGPIFLGGGETIAADKHANKRTGRSLRRVAPRNSGGPLTERVAKFPPAILPLEMAPFTVSISTGSKGGLSRAAIIYQAITKTPRLFPLNSITLKNAIFTPA